MVTGALSLAGSWIIGFLAVVGMFILLIAPHEGGHFALAKLFKVRVIEFSIGAGTKLLSFTGGGTLYAIRLLPILGYVRMGGMEADDFNAPSALDYGVSFGHAVCGVVSAFGLYIGANLTY